MKLYLIYQKNVNVCTIPFKLKNRFYNQIGLMKGYLLFINPIFDVEYKNPVHMR